MELENHGISYLSCYSDDITLSTSFAEENALEFSLTLNSELNSVNNWITSNRICFKADKNNPTNHI